MIKRSKVKRKLFLFLFSLIFFIFLVSLVNANVVVANNNNNYPKVILTPPINNSGGGSGTSNISTFCPVNTLMQNISGNVAQCIPVNAIIFNSSWNGYATSQLQMNQFSINNASSVSTHILSGQSPIGVADNLTFLNNSGYSAINNVSYVCFKDGTCFSSVGSASGSYWSTNTSQSGLSGDKDGTFNLTSTGYSSWDYVFLNSIYDKNDLQAIDIHPNVRLLYPYFSNSPSVDWNNELLIDKNNITTVYWDNKSLSGNWSEDGIGLCLADGTNCLPSTSGNPFDQSLNTTDNPQFNSLTTTGTLGTGNLVTTGGIGIQQSADGYHSGIIMNYNPSSGRTSYFDYSQVDDGLGYGADTIKLYSSGVPTVIMFSFNESSGNGIFPHNISIKGNLTAPNICYSNTTGCNLTASSTYNITYNRLLNQNCGSQVVNGTYANGTFICVNQSTSSGGNSSWNQSFANTLYYNISNPSNFYNSTTLPSSSMNYTNVVLTNKTNDMNNYNITNVTAISLTYSSSTATCSGGNITTDGLYTVNTFTSNGTFTCPTNNINLTVLVVAGGGGGGAPVTYPAGGGGAGGVYYNSSYTLNSTTVTVKVGTGGIAGTRANGLTGTNGANSTFGTITTTGGGGGASSDAVSGTNAGNGGSGGGGAYHFGTGGTGISGQGYNGGSPGASGQGGGGGGATAVGANYNNGGAGVAYSITGSSLYYAGGGGAADWASPGTGGSGVGGSGAKTEPHVDAGTPTANTGSGGGGGIIEGAITGLASNGANGVVIVRYLTSSLGTVTIQNPLTVNTTGNLQLNGVDVLRNLFNQQLNTTSNVLFNNINSTGNITASYKSADGTAGITASGTSCTITSIKNGLIVSAVCV